MSNQENGRRFDTVSTDVDAGRNFGTQPVIDGSSENGRDGRISTSEKESGSQVTTSNEGEKILHCLTEVDLEKDENGRTILCEPEQNYGSGVIFDAQGVNQRPAKYVTQDGKQLAFSFDQAQRAEAIPGIQTGTIDANATGNNVQRQGDPTTWTELGNLKEGEKAYVERMFPRAKFI